jgi:hypothetical protein
MIPQQDVTTMLKDCPDLTDLPVEQWPGFKADKPRYEPER